MAYITSTMSCPVVYTVYKTLPGKVRQAAAGVLVNGGANVADKRTILTPKGVCTPVTDEELELLKKHPVFKKHLERGFVAIVDTKFKEEAEKASSDLEAKDGSAPKTPEDYKAENKKSPKVKK